MTKPGKIALIITGIVGALFALGAIRLYWVFDYGVESPRIAVFSSPDGSRSAYLVWHGALKERTLSLLVSPSNSEENVRWIGSVVVDDTLTLEEMVWSRGGKQIVARCRVATANKPSSGGGSGLLTHGYDFPTAKRFVPERETFDTPEGWNARHEQLERLLREDGGGVTIVSFRELNNRMRKMKWIEWHRWRQRLQTARNKETDNPSKDIR